MQLDQINHNRKLQLSYTGEINSEIQNISKKHPLSATLAKAPPELLNWEDSPRRKSIFRIDFKQFCKFNLHEIPFSL